MKSRYALFLLVDRSEKIIEINKEFEDFEDFVDSAESIISVISAS
jgi:hypothetical protein